MVDHADKSLGSVSSVLERNGELGLSVFWVVYTVGLNGNVWAVGSRAVGCLEASGGAGGEGGEG
jgi:hypothetical protein